MLERGHYERGLFTGGISRISNLKSLDSLENGRIVLCFSQSGGSLESLTSLHSLDSLPKLDFSENREQKRHIKLLHIKLFPVAPVTGPPGRVSGQKDLCSLISEDST